MTEIAPVFIDWDMVYLTGRSWDLTPDQIWDMTLGEWFLEYEWRRPRDEGDFAGNLTQGDVDRLRELVDA